MSRTLQVAIAAGGTAGHINPALALAEELAGRGHSVTFFGQKRRLEGTLVPQAGYEFVEIDVSGFDRERPWTLVTALWQMRRSKKALSKRFAQQGAPSVAVGFGAYVEMPLLEWCRKNRVPYVIHEQNSVPGLANKTCAKGASAVCVSFPGATEAFKAKIGAQTSLVMTGNPVRRSVVRASRSDGRRAFGIAEGQTMLLVFGGSLGARHLNQAVAGLKDELLQRPDLTIVHSTGKELYDEVEASLGLTKAERERWRVVPYIDNMGEALAASDCVISRAGASSIAEIAALCVPSILVPYPLATEDHQTTNARFLVDAGAARLVPDDELDSEAFRSAVLELVGDMSVRDNMRLCAQSLAQDRAASALADQVEAAVSTRG